MIIEGTYNTTLGPNGDNVEWREIKERTEVIIEGRLSGERLNFIVSRAAYTEGPVYLSLPLSLGLADVVCCLSGGCDLLQ